MLEPNNYSIYVLCEDNTFVQPTVLVSGAISEHDFRMACERYFGGFISFGVELDCGSDDVVDIGL